MSVVTGFSDSPPVRLLQGIAIFAAGAAIIGSVVILAMTHMADWREPASEEEFEAIVQRAEELAALGYDSRLPMPSTPAGTTTARTTSTR